MGLDSISGASITIASSNPKDFAKKKRANRAAKLRQCKLDARREQWLSQVKNKEECKEEVSVVGDIHGDPASFSNERRMPIGKSEIKIKPSVEGEIHGREIPRHQYSDTESSPSNSPTNPSSSLLGSNDSVANLTESCGSNSGRSSSSGSNDFFPCNMSEDEDRDDNDGCLDDWEAMADALSAPDDKQPDHSLEPRLASLDNHGNSSPHRPHLNFTSPRNVITNGKKESGGTDIRSSAVQTSAWKMDDTFRPRCVPNLSRKHLNRGDPIPTSCPICYEDFDCTDSSFLPCSCGFRLCLFCHKTILDGDGRCPVCRKPYDRHPIEGEATVDGRKLTFRLIRRYSMKTRT